MGQPVVAGAQSTFSATNSLTAVLPASVAAGNILLCTVYSWKFGGASIVTGPSGGWTRLGTGVQTKGTSLNYWVQMEAYWKVAGGSEANFALSTDGGFLETMVTRITGATAIGNYAFQAAGIVADGTVCNAPNVTPSAAVGKSVLVSEMHVLRNSTSIAYESPWVTSGSGGFFPGSGVGGFQAKRDTADANPDGCTFTFGANCVAPTGFSMEFIFQSPSAGGAGIFLPLGIVAD